MVQPLKLAVTPFGSICHRAENITFKRRYLRRTVRQVLGLLQLQLEAIVRDILIRFLLLLTLWITEDCPEVSNAENHVRPLECSNKAANIIEVGLDHFDPFGLPGLCTFGRDITARTTDLPAWGLQVGIGNGAALNRLSMLVLPGSAVVPRTCAPVMPGTTINFDMAINMRALEAYFDSLIPSRDEC